MWYTVASYVYCKPLSSCAYVHQSVIRGMGYHACLCIIQRMSLAEAFRPGHSLTRRSAHWLPVAQPCLCCILFHTCRDLTASSATSSEASNNLEDTGLRYWVSFKFHGLIQDKQTARAPLPVVFQVPSLMWADVAGQHTLLRDMSQTFCPTHRLDLQDVFHSLLNRSLISSA